MLFQYKVHQHFIHCYIRTTHVQLPWECPSVRMILLILYLDTLGTDIFVNVSPSILYTVIYGLMCNCHEFVHRVRMKLLVLYLIHLVLISCECFTFDFVHCYIRTILMQLPWELSIGENDTPHPVPLILGTDILVNVSPSILYTVYGLMCNCHKSSIG